ncbi:MAG: hypothetical protein COT25_04070 [Candidatus Kerfeldbacteria bacterium CG08_land_8_20_14_0_20_42_7]|uniref:EamA domain-containing protein n=1 Tax=Candidatus Kerfeldbacteria bacterium CG08_land_8_20_14_0_20_42_7 TaxID=2014245 RepID=A0A2H0YU40_9BACT|nr:MAG: hypothetical protein COT25_04070 [Candidatus Kerfeldbacteria bacterium CG08_land_8_20_14_0_20_42_7]
MRQIQKMGILLALGTATISGFSTFFAKIAVTSVKNPVLFTTLKNSIVGLLLIGILLFWKKLPELKSISRADWIKLILIGIIGGSVPFILFFTGLTLTTAISAGFIHKMLFIWVALLAIPFLKERLSWIQGAAILLLVGGNIAILGTHSLSFGKGELLILLATIFWAVENIIAKKALTNLSSSVVAGARMVFGSIILLGVVVLQGNFHLVSNLSGTQWLWTLIPSVLLLGYVLTWYAALKRAPATIVASLLVPASLITNLLSLAFQGSPMTAAQYMGGALFAIAVGLIVWQGIKQHDRTYAPGHNHTS